MKITTTIDDESGFIASVNLGIGIEIIPLYDEENPGLISDITLKLPSGSISGEARYLNGDKYECKTKIGGKSVIFAKQNDEAQIYGEYFKNNAIAEVLEIFYDYHRISISASGQNYSLAEYINPDVYKNPNSRKTKNFLDGDIEYVD